MTFQSCFVFVDYLYFRISLSACISLSSCEKSKKFTLNPDRNYTELIEQLLKHLLNTMKETRKRAQQLRMFATLAQDLSLVATIHMVTHNHL